MGKKLGQRNSNTTPTRESGTGLPPTDDKGKQGDTLGLGRRIRKTKVVFDPSDQNPEKRMKLQESKVSVKTKKAPTPTKSLHSPEKKKPSKEETITLPVPKKEVSSELIPENVNCKLCSTNFSRTDKSVNCKDCSSRAHEACIEKLDLFLKRPELAAWKCADCAKCLSCKNISLFKPLFHCMICWNQYHLDCHNFISFNTIDASTSNKLYACHNCLESKIDVEPKTESVISNQVNCAKLLPEKNHCSPPWITINNEIPDAANWTCENVYKYFNTHFPMQAQVFREQEIDGRCLLLMKRSDIVNGLNLKLGTAIKIYSHVVMLQTRCSDKRLAWK